LEQLDASSIARLNVEDVPELLACIASQQARLSSLQATLAARLLLERRVARGRGPSAAGDETLGLQEAARLLHKSTSWVRRAVRRGELPFACRVGRSLIFPREELRTYLERAVPCYDSASNPTTPADGAGRARERSTDWRPRRRKERPA